MEAAFHGDDATAFEPAADELAGVADGGRAREVRNRAVVDLHGIFESCRRGRRDPGQNDAELRPIVPVAPHDRDGFVDVLLSVAARIRYPKHLVAAEHSYPPSVIEITGRTECPHQRMYLSSQQRILFFVFRRAILAHQRLVGRLLVVQAIEIAVGQ